MKVKKKLSVLIYSMAGGGAERVVSILVNELYETYKIILVLMSNIIVYNLPKDIEIFYLENSKPSENGMWKFLKLPYLGWKYKNFCSENKIDISLAFMNRPSYISIFAKFFGNRIKTIISERSTPSQIYSGNSLQSKISRFLVAWLYPYADLIITNSLGNKDDLIVNFGINEEKLITIYNPFDIKKIQELSSVQVSFLDFSKFTFISVGRIVTGKNYKLLIESFRKTLLKDAQLIIIGEGELKGELEDIVQRYDLQEQIFFIGFDSNPYKYMIKSDCFVFSSNYEGFPNVLVEALACELPIISTNCKSGPDEILGDGKFGILTTVGSEKEMIEAMKKIYTNQKLREQLHNQALLRAKQFNKNKIIRQYLDVL